LKEVTPNPEDIALLVSIAFSSASPVSRRPRLRRPSRPTREEGGEKAEKKETKADCLKMAKDDAAKSECEKKYAKATKETKETKKKEETTKKP
jgi:hypothetical protein